MERLLDILLGVCVAGVVAFAWAEADAAADRMVPSQADEEVAPPATMAAVFALYVAGDDAQRAVVSDVCEGDVMAPDVTAAGDALTGEAKRQYGHVREALQAAYDATAMTDGELEAVRVEWCAWASER